MSGRQETIAITGTSPAAAGRAVIGKQVGNIESYDDVVVVASLVGATGGTLDIYLQRLVDTNLWVDWIHFPQLAAGAAAVKYSAASMPPAAATAVVVGTSADDVTSGAAPALAANTVVAGHPGSNVRVVAVAGAGTTLGAAVDVRLMLHRNDY